MEIKKKYTCNCRYDCGKVLHDIDELKQKISQLKKNNLSIVLTQGTWDLVHIGHARYMQEAKKHGDVLIVGVDSDEKVRSRKGPDRPIVPEEERLEIVSHLRWPDYLILKYSSDPKWHLIKMIRPDVLIATKETYEDSEIKELKKYCKKILVLEPKATTSTSAKIRLLNITTANKIEKLLAPKIAKAIDEVLMEVKEKAGNKEKKS